MTWQALRVITDVTLSPLRVITDVIIFITCYNQQSINIMCYNNRCDGSVLPLRVITSQRKIITCYNFANIKHQLTLCVITSQRKILTCYNMTVNMMLRVITLCKVNIMCYNNSLLIGRIMLRITYKHYCECCHFLDASVIQLNLFN